MTKWTHFSKILSFLNDFLHKKFKKWTNLAKSEVQIRTKNIVITFRNSKCIFI